MEELVKEIADLKALVNRLLLRIDIFHRTSAAPMGIWGDLIHFSTKI